MRNLLLALVFVLLPFTDAFAGLSLTTLFNSNNNLKSAQDGTMFFDIENIGPRPINILSWDINIECMPGMDLSVYYREGTSMGFEDTMDGWMLLGTIVSLDCAGEDNRTPLAIGGLIIDSGETKGFAMVEQNTNEDDGIWYTTNGTGSNEIYSDNFIELRTSVIGDNFPAGTLIEPRVWNGTVFYELVVPIRNVPTLSEWGLIAMAGLFVIAGVMVLRRKKIAT